jgi:hypothetical protein
MFVKVHDTDDVILWTVRIRPLVYSVGRLHTTGVHKLRAKTADYNKDYAAD